VYSQSVSPLGSSLFYGQGRLYFARWRLTFAQPHCVDNASPHLTGWRIQFWVRSYVFGKSVGHWITLARPGTAGFIILVFQEAVLSVCSATSTLAFVRGCCWPPLRHRCTLPKAMTAFSRAVPALLWPQLPAEQLGNELEGTDRAASGWKWTERRHEMRAKQWAVVNTAVRLGIPKNGGEFLELLWY